MSRSVFVTGAAGYVGRRVVADLLARGAVAPVSLVRREPDDRPEERADGSPRWAVGDLTRPETYESELAGCERVIHLAARTGRAGRRAFWRDNVEGTRALLDACRRCGTESFVHVSTIAVHFENLDDYPYAASKAEAEAAVRTSGLPHAIVRPTLVLGPGAPAAAALSTLARSPFTVVPGDGRTPVQPIYVGDLARVLADLARVEQLPEGSHDLGGREVLTVRELLGGVRRALGAGEPRRFVHVPLRPLELLVSGLAAVFPSSPPLARGQLSTFHQDGRVRDGELQQRVAGSLVGTDVMLDRSFADGRSRRRRGNG